MKNIFLTGFMGSGKTTVGRLVAEWLGKTFVDVDDEVEKRMGKPISEIFSQSGEDAFRAVEAQVVAEVVRGSDKVVALGGGALMNAGSRAAVDASGVVIALTCAPHEILRRLRRDGHARPLLAPAVSGSSLKNDVDASVAGRRKLIEDLMASRAPGYESFPHIDTTNRTPAAVAADVISIVQPAASGEGAMPFREIAIEDRFTSRLFFGDIDQVFATIDPPSVAVLVADAEVDRLHGRRISEVLGRAHWRVVEVTVPGGEDCKSLEAVRRLYGECRRAGVDRKALIVAAGGGSVSDAAGFVAATYLRGVRLVVLPTTLVAQVDAAIGGKVGLNLGEIKNQVGAFYLAEVVAIDPAFLSTTQPRQLAEGLAEMIKMALIRDAKLFDDLESLEDVSAVRERPDLIHRAALIKAAVVESDPYDRGERFALNFGHTVGHAIEAATGFDLPHGFAVAIGMVAATRLAVELRLSSTAMLERLEALLLRFDLPTRLPPDLDPEVVRGFMEHDKKRAREKIQFVLPLSSPGEGFVTKPIAEDMIQTLLTGLRQ